jgi:hypothetical protein
VDVKIHVLANFIQRPAHTTLIASPRAFERVRGDPGFSPVITPCYPMILRGTLQRGPSGIYYRQICRLFGKAPAVKPALGKAQNLCVGALLGKGIGHFYGLGSRLVARYPQSEKARLFGEEILADAREKRDRIFQDKPGVVAPGFNHIGALQELAGIAISALAARSIFSKPESCAGSAYPWAACPDRPQRYV